MNAKHQVALNILSDALLALKEAGLSLCYDGFDGRVVVKTTYDLLAEPEVCHHLGYDPAAIRKASIAAVDHGGVTPNEQ